jgi:hypothetical protein
MVKKGYQIQKLPIYCLSHLQICYQDNKMATSWYDTQQINMQDCLNLLHFLFQHSIK